MVAICFRSIASKRFSIDREEGGMQQIFNNAVWLDGPRKSLSASCMAYFSYSTVVPAHVFHTQVVIWFWWARCLASVNNNNSIVNSSQLKMRCLDYFVDWKTWLAWLGICFWAGCWRLSVGDIFWVQVPRLRHDWAWHFGDIIRTHVASLDVDAWLALGQMRLD